MKKIYRVYGNGCDCTNDFKGDIGEDLGDAIEDLVETIENGVCRKCDNVRASITKIYVKDNEKDYMNYDREQEEDIYRYVKWLCGKGVIDNVKWLSEKVEKMRNKGERYEAEKRYLRTLEKLGDITSEECEKRIHNYRIKNGLV